MFHRAWIRRIALTVAATALAGTQLLTPAIAAPAVPPPSGAGELLAHVPPEIRSSCLSATDRAAAEGWLPVGASEVQACPVDTASGTTVAFYIAFDDPAALQAAFVAETPAPANDTCDDGNPGQIDYVQGDAPETAGEMACFQLSDGLGVIAWTHEQTRILAILVDPQLDLAQLTHIWTSLGPVVDTDVDQLEVPA